MNKPFQTSQYLGGALLLVDVGVLYLPLHFIIVTIIIVIIIVTFIFDIIFIIFIIIRIFITTSFLFL